VDVGYGFEVASGWVAEDMGCAWGKLQAEAETTIRSKSTHKDFLIAASFT